MSTEIVGAETVRSADVEPVLAGALAELLDVERVAPDAHFFDDLGADSMVMARFCARLRKRADLPAVSMKEVYGHPTVASLATQLASRDCGTVAVSDTPETTAIPQSRSVVVCGTLQALALIAYAGLAGLVAAWGYDWISTGTGVVDIYLRSLVVGVATFVGLCALPITAKWALVGRWQRQEIRLWSLAYVRFWVVKTLIQRNPLVAFVGTPIYPLYLRALGAKVGRGAAIFSRHVPVCTDLLTIGAGAVVRQGVYLNCYRAAAGRIRTGPVAVGAGGFVGEASVLDIDTVLGDYAQLAHASSLHAGQTVPDGERRHGSPAQPTDVDFRMAEPARCGSLRRVAYSIAQLLRVLALQLPLAIGGLVVLIAEIPQLDALIGSEPADIASGTLYRDAMVSSLVLFFGLAIVGLLVVATVPRLLNLMIRPERVYPLYGPRYAAQRTITRLTNVRFFTYLFGDSSAIVHYLRGVGYQLSPVEQTGSNFGLDVRHENPYLSAVGSGTMVADGLSMLNADFTSTSFRVSRTAIGPRNFVGNYVAYPARGRTGDDCLLATKVMVPVDGEVREGVGLLGSPSFEIPRSVHRDSRFDHLKVGAELRRRLAAKNRHNAVTMGLFLLTGWVRVFVAMVIALVALDLYDALGAAAIALAGVTIAVFAVAYSIVVERAAAGFRSLKPRYCSIYEPYFWWHERYWKLSTQPRILDGTPFKSLVWRFLGVRIGARVFDDGCIVMEKTLVTIGDDCVLNAGSIIQAHSQEDGTFKSDRIAIGDGCAIGVGALVHYGVSIGDGVSLAPDSFLMKGEEVPSYARWGGNPARQLQRHEGTGA